MKPSLPTTLVPGRCAPFGTQLRDDGVNFAVWSEHAERIELCVFDAEGNEQQCAWPLHGPEHGVFHGFLPGTGAGLVYGLRAHGPFQPEVGHRFNPHKLLLDPYAREIVGRFQWLDEHHGYPPGHPDGASAFDDRDNARHALKARVAADDIGAKQRPPRPRLADADVVLYEVHVKGFSMALPGIPEQIRGSFEALAHPAAIAHFQQLGVTTLCLLPVHYALPEAHLAKAGLSNYWGYNTLGFFCPDPRLGGADTDPAALNPSFRQMVDTLHAHGLEVVLDVVFNHTAEGDETGPTLSFRGLDNASWYWLMSDDRSRCENYSHCGNTLKVRHPRVTQFVLDVLRYWVQQMGVDGFRFDLAPILGRTRHGFDPDAAFFVALRQDPVLAEVRLIAEPWDGGPDGYQVGRFPARFVDWNDRFRDAVRGFWLHRSVNRGEFARRFTASSDLFHHASRLPTASVNFISAHDGFTLADVVSYSHKHNEANGEGGRDGRNDELCANFGCEGPSDDPAIVLQRRRLRHAMLATLLLAQGTPMLCAGDEFGNSQDGNNNAYCQDNPLGWLNWERSDLETLALTRQLLALRREDPLLRHPQWFAAQDQGGDIARVAWRNPDGALMQVHDWHDHTRHAFCCELLPPASQQYRLLLLFNPEPDSVDFALESAPWRLLFDSSAELAPGAVSASLTVPAQALLVLRSPSSDEPQP